MRSGRLVSHVALSVGANIWLTIVAIFTMPYVLLGLGRSAYGVFAMISLVSAHLSNLELGFGHATIRFLARAKASKDQAAAQAILDTSFAVFAVAGMLAGTLFFFGSSYLATSIFNIPEGLQREAITAFRLGAFILACSFLSSYFSAALQALGCYDRLNAYRMVAGTIASLASVAAIMLGKGLIGVLAAQAGIAFVAMASYGLAVVRAHGGPVKPHAKREFLREMAGFGVLVFAAGIAYQWMINGPPLVLSAKVDVAILPTFAVPHVVLQRLAAVVSSVSLVFFPFASAESARNDRSRLTAVFQSHLRLTVLVMGPIAAYLVVFGQTLLAVWVSPDFARDASPCLRLLAPAALVLAETSPGADVARALGRPAWVLAYTSGVALVATGACFALIPGYGAVGAALALLVGMIAGFFPLTAAVALLLLGLRPVELIRKMLLPVLAVVAVTILYRVGQLMSANLLSAIATGVIVTAAYAAVSYAWIIDPRERDALNSAAGLA
jgi:O-antigen/teichoic acid export membrane protein